MEFDLEVIRLDGCLVTGTVTVEDDGEELEAIAFEPEDGRLGLSWSTMGPACETWLQTNKRRVQWKYDQWVNR